MYLHSKRAPFPFFFSFSENKRQLSRWLIGRVALWFSGLPDFWAKLEAVISVIFEYLRESFAWEILWINGVFRFYSPSGFFCKLQKQVGGKWIFSRFCMYLLLFFLILRYLAMPAAYQMTLKFNNDYKDQCHKLQYLVARQRELCTLSKNMLAIVSRGNILYYTRPHLVQIANSE